MCGHTKSRIITACLALAAALAGCTDPQTQAEEDHGLVQAEIVRQLGPNQPFGTPRIINAHRSETKPDTICGYWDKYVSSDRRTWMPFAVSTTGSISTIYSVGDGWIDQSVNEIGQAQNIYDECGIDHLHLVTKAKN
ncbi:hypothetical protein [Sphingomonas aerolata]|uniref:hypothetical protein n=1 Tax=Sphingomonas aerolata TaxID=185951 RepID=UPI00208FCE89|nr:hypothetical protein [Sphingomonas aerolata]USR00114.1 hypothetical protein NEF64_17275 [Sphingomonas aerolata]